MKDILPGHRAFSVFAKSDPRVNVDVLRTKLGALPLSPIDENRVWYRLYKQCENEPSVIDAHRRYLLSRDMTAVASVFTVVGLISMLVLSPTPLRATIYCIGMVTQYVLLALVSRNSGNSLVRNVLAVSSSAES